MRFLKVIFLVLFVFLQVSQAQWVSREPRRQEIPNEPPNVTSLTFDKDVVYSSCAGITAAECEDEGAKITVTTTAEDKENDLITYSYKVLKGRIIGQGASVVWDLSGTEPGIYTLLVWADDGWGDCGRKMTKTVEVKAAPDVEDVILDNSIALACPQTRRPGPAPSGCTKEGMIVDVVTKASNVTGDLEYYYAVSGGEVLGGGPNVKWDLRNTIPGTYTITVGIGKNNVVSGRIITRTLTETLCSHCDIPCECPEVSPISGPSRPVRAGETLVFHSKVKWIDNRPGAVKWSVSEGTILNDPASPSIMVKVPADMKDGNITAIFELLDTQPSCSCPRVDTLTVSVKKR
jgi:hypothetical protein